MRRRRNRLVVTTSSARKQETQSKYMFRLCESELWHSSGYSRFFMFFLRCVGVAMSMPCSSFTNKYFIVLHFANTSPNLFYQIFIQFLRWQMPIFTSCPHVTMSIVHHTICNTRAFKSSYMCEVAENIFIHTIALTCCTHEHACDRRWVRCLFR